MVSVEAVASRAGYLTSTVPSADTAAVLPGQSCTAAWRPCSAGTPWSGTPSARRPARWSVRPDAFQYQWYAGRTKIQGATGATYDPTAAEAGDRLHVVVTALRDGYTPVTASSQTSDRVVFGRVAFAKPTIRGHAVVGHTIHAPPRDLSRRRRRPLTTGGTATETRSSGARDAAYVVQEADLGHSLHVVVTMRAAHWISRTKRSAPVTDVRTRPRLHAHTSIRHGRVFLRLVVDAAGPELGQRAGDGVARAPPGRTLRWSRTGPAAGCWPHCGTATHTLTLVYRGGPEETTGRATVNVRVP